MIADYPLPLFNYSLLLDLHHLRNTYLVIYHLILVHQTFILLSSEWMETQNKMSAVNNLFHRGELIQANLDSYVERF
jgi:hypothetical protein